VAAQVHEQLSAYGRNEDGLGRLQRRASPCRLADVEMEGKAVRTRFDEDKAAGVIKPIQRRRVRVACPRDVQAAQADRIHIKVSGKRP
jgi:hypothetical protein